MRHQREHRKYVTSATDIREHRIVPGGASVEGSFGADATVWATL